MSAGAARPLRHQHRRVDEGGRRLAVAAALLAVVGAAWAALAVWGASAQGRYLDHAALESPSPAAVGFVLLGWVAMVTAMMLPTAWPLVRLFSAMVATRRRPGVLVALLVAGYLTVWAGFGVAAIVGDRALHELVERVGWLDQRAWLITAGVLLAAGAYQFSSLKYRCLDQCRTPRFFLMSRWTGGREARRAFRIGVDHGQFCVGCCWTLMLLLFAVGAGNLAWMLGLGALMAFEKNVAVPRSFSTALGGTLVTAGFVVGVAQ